MSAPEDEPFLERWLRRKNAALADEVEEPDPPAVEPPPTETEAPLAEADVASSEAAPREITDADLPDLSDLGEDSDYSAFMASGVSPEKRRAALRQLFHSAKFNVIDGLDDYCEDFTKFEPLGAIVTAEMRHHAERLARKALGEEEEAPDAAAASPAPAATEEQVAADATTTEPADPDDPPEPSDQEERENPRRV